MCLIEVYILYSEVQVRIEAFIKFILSLKQLHLNYHNIVSSQSCLTNDLSVILSILYAAFHLHHFNSTKYRNLNELYIMGQDGADVYSTILTYMYTTQGIHIKTPSGSRGLSG